MNPESLLKDLKSIARAAGEEILAIYADEEKFQRVDFKANDSPLTLADQAAHNVIVAKLAEITPDIPVLSEEGRDIPYSERSQWTQFWLVDPLDGTKEFIKRNGEFTVNIALVENGNVIMGCVHVPVLNTTYSAAKGLGAFVEREGEAETKIQVADFSMTDKGLRIVCSRSHMSADVEQYVSQFDAPETVSMGSSLKLVLVAEGKADIYPRLGPTMEWDTAAAQVVVEQAGGTVINHETGAPLTYNKENLLNPYFIVFANKQESADPVS
ncbi:3'(2'),5'-bisphosphate nucleotidase CysQ [Pontibacter sp. G13]|uniref:3'(2'),5'-bisphosphate nucleotidase CysQ n=1 Tax=Pontibacter sp. G13 TaxID=3074898 RepID=UPI00288A3C8B|nr:3'(2'),5'-bisphosphate nucleotidase CysQ [Pontibacter sp. G13]WNJ16643.1 3'(2'),5'-bisphosphate nucleotidase CysQ [Pontibacter sp. G13]